MSRLLARYVLLSLVWALPAVADVAIYTDGVPMPNGFANYSYGGGDNFGNAAPFHNGAPSIAFTAPAASSAVSFAHPSGTFASASYSGLRFFINGGASGGQQLKLLLQTNSNVASTPVTTAVALNAYIAGGVVPANAWAQVDVPFNSLTFNNDGNFDRIDLRNANDLAQPTLYIDDVSLISGNAASNNYVFGDSFEPEYLFVPQYTASSIKVYQRLGSSSDFTFVHEAPLAAGAHPNAVVFAPDGSLWVVDDVPKCKLRRFTLQSILTDAIPAEISSVQMPAGFSLFDMKFFGGYAYVSTSDFGGTNAILKSPISALNAADLSQTVILNGGGNLNVPAGLAFDSLGRLWIGNYGNNTLVRMIATTGTIDWKALNAGVGATRNALNQSEGLAFDEFGSLWLGNNGEPTVSVYSGAQLNAANPNAAVSPVYQIDIAPGVFNGGFVGGIAIDRHGDLRANYEYATQVLGYTFTAPAYAATPLAPMNGATTNPGRGGIAIWPVPGTVHR